MSAKLMSQWRTVLVAIVGCLLLLGAFVVLVLFYRPGGPSSEAVRAFEALKDGIEVLVVGVALKAGIQHLAGGGGVKGALASLITDAKPDGGAPAAPPPASPTGFATSSLMLVLALLGALALAACAAPRPCHAPAPDTVAEREARLSPHARDWLEALRHSYECSLAKENVRRAVKAGDEAALRENARVWAGCKED